MKRFHLAWVLLLIMVIVCAGCSCDDDDDDDDNNDDNDNNDAVDDDDDNDSSPPGDCQIIQCERPDYNRLPHERTGTCFPDECEESVGDWYDGCATILRPVCDEAVVLAGKVWSRCSTRKLSHFCAACSAEVLELCGYDDWRLPTYEEARSLYDPSRLWEVPGAGIGDEAYIRTPFFLYDYNAVWLFVDDNTMIGDFGEKFYFRTGERSTSNPQICNFPALFVRDLDGTESFASKERSKTARKQDH